MLFAPSLPPPAAGPPGTWARDPVDTCPAVCLPEALSFLLLAGPTLPW